MLTAPSKEHRRECHHKDKKMAALASRAAVTRLQSQTHSQPPPGSLHLLFFLSMTHRLLCKGPPPQTPPDFPPSRPMCESYVSVITPWLVSMAMHCVYSQCLCVCAWVCVCVCVCVRL